jgi:hypothetical protein
MAGVIKLCQSLVPWNDARMLHSKETISVQDAETNLRKEDIPSFSASDAGRVHPFEYHPTDINAA